MINLNDSELRQFWKDIYCVAIRAGDNSYVACQKADQAVTDLIRRGK